MSGANAPETLTCDTGAAPESEREPMPSSERTVKNKCTLKGRVNQAGRRKRKVRVWLGPSWLRAGSHRGELTSRRAEDACQAGGWEGGSFTGSWARKAPVPSDSRPGFAGPLSAPEKEDASPTVPFTPGLHNRTWFPCRAWETRGQKCKRPGVVRH